MASKIKGITVEIGGDTTKLSKALEGVNKELKDTQGDLRDVNRLLKLDPTNVTLLGQKQRLLGEAVAGTSKKLETLKAAAEQARQKLDIGEITQGQYDELQRSIVKTEHELEELGKQAKDTGKHMSRMGTAVKEIGDDAATVADKTKGLSKAVAAVGTAVAATVPATEDFRDSISKLEINISEAGFSMDEMSDKFKRFYAVTGQADSSVEALSNLLQTGFDDNQITAAVDALAGAVVRFPDTLNIESLADSLQETIATGKATGQYAELLDRLGIGADNASAGMENLTVAQRQWVAVDMLTRSGLSETYEEWEKNNKAMVNSRESSLSFKKALSELAETVTPLISRVTELAAAFLDWFNSISGGGKAAIAIIAVLLATLSPVASMVSSVSHVILNASTIFTVANVKIMALTAAIALLVTGLGAMVIAWGQMSGLEKVISVLGTLAAAATAAAIAMGVFHASATMGLAAAGIAAGIAAVTAAVMTAQKSAKSASASFTSPSAGFSAGGSYGAPAMSYSGGGGYQGQQMSRGGSQNITLQLDGATLGRAVVPYVNGENQRMGVQLAGG